MAGGMDLGNAKGPKKPLDATINLVPFIDLMAVTISFLIMTAVWTQIGRLQVAGGGGDGDPTPEKDDKTVPITLLLSEKELRLTVGTTAFGPHPRQQGSQGPARPDQARRALQGREGEARSRPDGDHHPDRGLGPLRGSGPRHRRVDRRRLPQRFGRTGEHLAPWPS